jgi:mannose-1-phosphate guanylyltransferase
MKAILLAAGYGSRLKPITEKIPKCLVPIGGKPLLYYWLDSLSEAGITQVLINTHYLPDEVNKSIAQYIKSSDLEICVIHEDVLCGTAGTIVKNINFLEANDCLLIHADNFMVESLDGLLDAHKNRPKFCEMTMLNFITNRPSECGIVEISSDGVVRGFYEKIGSDKGNVANAAVYAISNKLIKEIASEPTQDFSTQVIGKYIGKIYTYLTKEYFKDIGTVESYKEACKYKT